ncbi:MAG: hypothetical protein AMXMBFR33_10080 [Candidatus Xenobia bacterium]
MEGTLNGFPFRATLEPDGRGNHQLTVDEALREAAGAGIADTWTVEITRVGEEPETRVPAELREALAAEPEAQASWANTTPMARRDWILWITSARQPETRSGRVAKGCDMLKSGKRRVCCFGGLSWLVKEHPAVETWLPFPKAVRKK